MIAETLRSVATRLPSNMHILISSRFEDVIRDQFSSLIDSRTAFHVNLQTSSLADDVSQFFRHKIEGIMRREQMDSAVPEWRAEIGLDDLCTKASGLFIWAVTAATFIEKQIKFFGRGAFRHIRSGLSQQGMNNIDGLYRTILTDICPDPSANSASVSETRLLNY